MDFETFFTKKKIDIVKLKNASSELYDELYNSFQVMGAKSFDHSKKFFFNKWRKEFLLIPPAQDSVTTNTEEAKPKPYQAQFKRNPSA